jgi:pyruvate,water dikinase
VVVHEPLVDVDAATEEGRVLVTQHLGPDLAGLLPHLDGLVSETGSALSHVAILAREMGVPTVAGVAGARRRFRPGVRVVVDGTAGTVEAIGERSDTDEAGDAA